ncbi:calcium/sodium antiporter [bacterium]|nr:calcium/sodium antiporter [candidate division CSSED10-310 bacterium]
MAGLVQCGIVLLGFIFLILGADILVRGASGIARSFGVQPLVIGLTIVAYGTSLPEFMASFSAMCKGIPGIAVGNVLGSNICNIALVMGIAALLTPVRIEKDVFNRQIPITLLVTLILIMMFFTGYGMSRFEGAVFAIGTIIYTLWIFSRNRTPKKKEADESGTNIFERNRWVASSAIVVGSIGLFLGGDWVVDGSTALARGFHVPERVIGGTLVALGTSLPELITTVVGILRNETDLGVGNAVGSCIFNLLMILGFTALVNPISADPLEYSVEFAFSIGSLIFLGVMGSRYNVIGIKTGVFLVLLYLAFIGMVL